MGRRQLTSNTKHALPAPALSTFLTLALAIAVPLIVVGITPDVTDLPWELSLATVVLAGFRLSVVIGSRSRRMLEAMFWVFAYVFMGLAPMVQMRLGVTPETTPGADTRFYGTAAVIALVGCAAVALGSVLARRSDARQTTFDPPVLFPNRRVASFGAVMILIAVAYVALIGVGPFFDSRGALNDARFARFGDPSVATIVAAVVSMGLSVSFVAQAFALKQRQAAGAKRPILMISLTLALLLFCVNPISSPRFVFGTALLAVAVALGASATVSRSRTLIISAVIALVVVFPVADAFRHVGVVDAQSQGVLDSLTTSDFDSFAQLATTVEYVTQAGPTWGAQAIGAILFFVPRAIWPTKPIDTGVMLAEWKGYNFTNLSAPLWSEFFIDFGWVGLVIGMAALGFAFRRLDARADRSFRASGALPVYMALLPFYLLIILRGSLLQAMTYLAVIIIASWWVGSGSKRRPAASSEGRGGRMTRRGQLTGNASTSSARPGFVDGEAI